jgi:signal transduction histidine kinase
MGPETSHAPGFGRRRRAPWLVFGLCALLVVDVLAWASWRVLALERAERTARAQADTAQRERLALWQMDSLVSAIVARESARPYFEYRAAYAADLPYGQAWSLGQAGAVVPSTLVDGTGDPVVRLHYQVEPDGRIVSPQAPDAPAEAGAPVDAADRLRAQRWVRELGLRIAGQPSAAAPPDPAVQDSIAGRSRMASGGASDDRGADARGRRESSAGADPVDTQLADSGSDGAGSGGADLPTAELESVVAAADAEPEPDGEPEDAQLRQQLFDIARTNVNTLSIPRAAGDAAEPPVMVGVFRPRWLETGEGEPELVFERGVTIGERSFRQGIWLDWPALRAQLLSVAVRLVPGATLEPVAGPPTRGPDTLATIPLRLVVPVSVGPAPFWTPTRVTLAVSWLAALVALVAVGVVLRTAMRLAERRGRFVAAVTHELRSPLTSLRLHTDLLARASDDEQRGRHVGVLRSESARLGEVIESVLVYAGLRPPTEERTPVALGGVLTPLLDTFRASAAEAGAELIEEIADAAASARVRVRPGSVERILSNLVDNACRYAVGEGHPVVRLSARREGRTVRIRVADNGPGVDPAERELIFADFYRGRASSRSHRGIGLGLALGRGLARAEGGDLRLVETDRSGASFELSLPCVHASG